MLILVSLIILINGIYFHINGNLFVENMENFKYIEHYKNNSGIEISLLSDNYTIIHEDKVGDVWEYYIEEYRSFDSVDIYKTSENINMSVVNVTFVGKPGIFNESGNYYNYFCYIDSNRDNETYEYFVHLEIIGGGALSCICDRNDKYWNGSGWQDSSIYNPDYAYIEGNSVIFNFSSCVNCCVNNWYKIVAVFFNSTCRYDDYDLGNINKSYYFPGLSTHDLVPPKIIEFKLEEWKTHLEIGDSLEFSARVVDDNNMSMVWICISDEWNKTIERVKLYDDGMHGDGLAGDDWYGANWSSDNIGIGIYIIWLYANDTTGNEARKYGLWCFSVGNAIDTGVIKNLELVFFDQDMKLRYMNYTYMGNYMFRVYANFSGSGQLEGEYYVSNATRWRYNTTMAFYKSKCYSGYFIDREIGIGDKVLIEFGGKKVEVVGEEWWPGPDCKIWTKCWVLKNNSLGIEALYEQSSGLLMYYFLNGTGESLQLLRTNIQFEARQPYKILNPLNITYNSGNLKIVLKNETSADNVWFRYKNESGDWTKNYTLSYNGTHWIGELINLSMNLTYKLQVIINWASWNYTNEVVFTIKSIENNDNDGETSETKNEISAFEFIPILTGIGIIIVINLFWNRECKRIRIPRFSNNIK